MHRTKIIFHYLLLFIAIILLLACLKSANKILLRLSGIMRTTSSNLISNGTFKENLKYWKYDNNIKVVETNGEFSAYISTKDKKATKLWQDINVISGYTYQLSFTLNGPSKGGFVIYRDSKTGKEEYLWCHKKNDSARYLWEVKPNRSGNNQIYFCANEPGQFYFSNIEFKKKNIVVIIIYYMILTIILLIFLQNKSIFLVILITLALIPILKINNIQESKTENRSLSLYKPLFNKNTFNINFSEDFNNWINDQFWLRNKILKTQNSLNFLINKRFDNKYVIQGSNNWIFLKENLKIIAKPDTYYNNIYKQTKDSLIRLDSFCKGKKIKLYIIVTPFGEEIYNEELTNVNINHKIGRFGKITRQINKETGIDILYVYKDINEAKTNALVQYKTDHHWSKYGAYCAYNKIFKKICDDFMITNYNKKQYNYKRVKKYYGFGETFKYVKNINDNICQKLFPTNDEYLDLIPINNNISDDGRNTQNTNGINKRIFLFGDSYTRIIKDYFAYDFQNTRYMIKPLQIYMPIFENEILSYKPDIVVMIIYSQNYELIKNWYQNK